jgi:glutathione S-transferase
MLQLFGHPFSSYTWKALIPLYTHALPFRFRMLGPDHPENQAVVQQRTPAGKFPVLLDGEPAVFEATGIIAYRAATRPLFPPGAPDRD